MNIMKHSNQSGYILMLTLMLMAISIILVTQMSYQGTTFRAYAQTVFKREQAKQLALSGIQLMLSKLNETLQQEEKKSEKPQ